MAELTLYFNASVSGPTDPSGVWFNDAAAFDGSIEPGHEAVCGDKGDADNKYLAGVGVENPASEPAIYSVKARVYVLADLPGGFAVGLNDWSEVLGTDEVPQYLYDWTEYITLTPPAGGWTWDDIKNLQVRFWSGFTSEMSYFMVFRAEILVETGPTFYDTLYPSLYPVIGLQVHGRMAHWWVHKEYKRYKVVAKYYYPYNPQTEVQQGWRNFFAYAVSNWQGFDAATKNYYNELKRPRYMSGYNRYLSMYLDANYSP